MVTDVHSLLKDIVQCHRRFRFDDGSVNDVWYIFESESRLRFAH